MELSWEGILPEPEVRTVDEVRSVLAYPECPCSGPIYFMYRNIAKNEEDQHWLDKKHLRYDLTVIPPKTICGEYVKTKGHYHPDAPSGTGYPELYELLAGEAHYLIQSRGIDNVICIQAAVGEKVVIPPGFGHVTINPSPLKTITMANLVSSKFSSDYKPYEASHGAAYYEILGGQFIKNINYPQVPTLRCLPPKA
jgi:glucose-6-phosphate isomerase